MRPPDSIEPKHAPLMRLQNVAVKIKVSREFSSPWNLGIFYHLSKVFAAKFRLLQGTSVVAISLKNPLLFECNDFDVVLKCSTLMSRINSSEWVQQQS